MPGCVWESILIGMQAPRRVISINRNNHNNHLNQLRKYAKIALIHT